MLRIAAAATILAFGTLLGLPVLIDTARADVVVSISKSQQRLAVTVDGRERYRWRVSTGRRGLETPSGVFRPIRLERKWYSRKYDWSPMPYSIFFHRGYAVHGTLERRNLGRPASHGCVRLLPAHASTLFKLVRAQGKANARIVVMNGPLPPPPSPVRDPMIDIASATTAKAQEPAAKANRKPAKADAADIVIKVPLPPPFTPVFAAAPKPEAARPAMASLAVPMPRPRAAAPAPRKPQTRTYSAAHRAFARHEERPRADDNFVSVGDDAAVMRGRQAWLRSLDREYGIVH